MSLPKTAVFFAISCLTFFHLVNALAQSSQKQIPAAPPVVSRADWGARPAKADISKWSDYGLTKPTYTKVVLHITNMSAGTGKAEAQRIQNKQMDDLGFSDIAYNFLIDADGTIFEGRPLTFVPSHAGEAAEANQKKDITLDPDYAAIGISFSAASDERLTTAQLASAYALIAFWKAHPKFDIQSVITHAEVKQELLDKGLTPIGKYSAHECPGTRTRFQIQELRYMLRENLGIPFDESSFIQMF